jgi:hypothetical protein
MNEADGSHPGTLVLEHVIEVITADFYRLGTRGGTDAIEVVLKHMYVILIDLNL